MDYSNRVEESNTTSNTSMAQGDSANGGSIAAIDSEWEYEYSQDETEVSLKHSQVNVTYSKTYSFRTYTLYSTSQYRSNRKLSLPSLRDVS